jgi:peptidoglycan/xylan/chitin deacetylase (PgdA/CDA1 family)
MHAHPELPTEPDSHGVTRWDWSWEDHAGASPTAESALQVPAWLTPPAPPSDPGARLRYRRRRQVAAIVLAAAIALIVGVLSHGGGSRRVHSFSRAPRPDPAQLAAQAAAADQRAVDATLARTPFVVSGGGAAREVALTFDDGPGPYTPRLVARLSALHAPATFFAVGTMERYFAAGTLAEQRAGFAIGDHSETHPFMAQLNRRDQRQELVAQAQSLTALGVPYPRLFRPPYGSYDRLTFRELRRQHMLMVLWSADTGDFRQPGVAVIVHNALSAARPGAIILMHDGGGDRAQTIAALPAIVRGLRARGLEPVTVPRLLRDDPPPAGQQIPAGLAGG